jgi:signal transduction histidine kinase
MKLLTRGTLMFMSITSVVFTVGSWLFHEYLTSLATEDTEKRLIEKKETLLSVLETDTALTSSPLAPDVSITATSATFKESAIDTMIDDALAEEQIAYRQLRFPYERNNKFYAVTLRAPLSEHDDLVKSIFTTFVVVLTLLAVVIIIGMQIFSRNIWKPFLATLKIMEDFRPGSKQTVVLPETDLKEFRQLNATVQRMTANSEAYFQSLRSFSENAAHEIQTPLAVIQSTTEVLLQDETLNEEHYKTISHLSSTTTRLSSIVSALLLLTRIENKQFRQETPIDVSEVVNSKIELYRELFEQKQIAVSISVEAGVRVKLHRVLAEILISNLLVNALRHTKENGRVSIVLTPHEFTVRNSGLPLKGDATRIFERFYKEDQSELSTGLGLSLVKMVTDVSGLEIAYRFEQEQHIFSVTF